MQAMFFNIIWLILEMQKIRNFGSKRSGNHTYGAWLKELNKVCMKFFPSWQIKGYD